MDTAPPLPDPAAPLGARRGISVDPTAWAPRAWLDSLPLVRIAIVALAALLRLYALELRPPHFDEGVNGWFLDQMKETGFYKYDRTNYLGPLHC